MWRLTAGKIIELSGGYLPLGGKKIGACTDAFSWPIVKNLLRTHKRIFAEEHWKFNGMVYYPEHGLLSLIF